MYPMQQSWFEELPVKLLKGVSENLLLSASSESAYLSLMDMMKEPQKSIFRWLLEVFVDVYVNASSNNVDINLIGF